MTIQRQKGKQTDLSIAMQLVHDKVTAHSTTLRFNNSQESWSFKAVYQQHSMYLKAVHGCYLHAPLANR
jgi:hypothetical protein